MPEQIWHHTPVWHHTPQSINDGINHALVALPSLVTGNEVFVGKLQAIPQTTDQSVPTVVALHGSGGINLEIEQWQHWLATHGFASITFDSLQLTNRLSYQSPVAKDLYEKMHSLRLSEIDIVVDALKSVAWADSGHYILAGKSEGSVAVARYAGDAFRGKIIYSWSCENNYFVEEHRTAINDVPVLNIIGTEDEYFGKNGRFSNSEALTGNCAEALKNSQNAQVVLIPKIGHSVVNVPTSRSATLGWLIETLQLNS